MRTGIRERIRGGFAIRIILPVGVTLALLLTAFFFFVIPEFENSLRNRHRETLRQLVSEAVTGLGSFRAAEESGFHTREEAQKEALGHIRALRYGADDGNHYWVTDFEGVVLAHPSRPELEGISATDYAGPSPVRPPRESLELIRRQGAGYVEYAWPSREDPDKLIHKLAYLAVFEPWGWIVGTSAHTVDIDREVAAFTRKVALVTLAIFFFAAALVSYAIRQSLKVDTKRRAAQGALRQSEQRFRQLAELLPDIVYEMDENGMLTFVNKQAYSISGYSREDFDRGFKAITLFAGEDHKRASENILRVMRGENIGPTEYTAVHRDGRRFPVLAHSMPVIKDGRPAGIRGIIIDITELKRAQAALEQSQQNYRVIFQEASDPVAVYDIESRALIDVNRPFCELFRVPREQALKLTGADVGTGTPPFSRPDALRYLRLAAEGKPQVFEWLATDSTGRTFWTEVSMKKAVIGGKASLVAVVRDISDRKRLEEQLRQAQKMEAVGQLAGGIAHDFNNLLTAIGGYTDLALARMDPSDPNVQNLNAMKSSIERAAGLTRQLLAFSRSQVLDKRVVNLNFVIQNARGLLAHFLGERVELTLSLRPGLPTIEADATLIEQVLVNLAMNAKDAMRDGGRILIETTEVEMDERAAAIRGDIAPGRYAMMAVTDEGIGMDEQTLSHVFEPFFTTKGPDRGTGLGLSMAYGIVRQHGGHIEGSSSPGAGARFAVFLPISGQPFVIEPGSPDGGPAGGRETVLVIEDDDLVRPMTGQALRSYGYDVIETSGPAEAIERCGNRRSGIDMVLTDVLMPEMNAPELIARLREIRPGIKVLCVSGHAPESSSDVDPPCRDGCFLQKPFTIAELASKVREILDQPEETPEPGRT
ncbi:MAG: PAS domain S-box protein [Planctomycetota bacterium]|jgi:PAS domain S-box-containing protein